MRDRLTKAQVEDLLEHLDGPFDELAAAIARAVASLAGSGPDLDATLRTSGRGELADRLRNRDESAAWELATELNELRHL